ncbi:hypothetical protein I5481_20980 [Citrobacter freundii]|nr:hypothetical protein [Citrobacter freundii]
MPLLWHGYSASVVGLLISRIYGTCGFIWISIWSVYGGRWIRCYRRGLYGSEFFTSCGGICRGSALSPLLGASFLWYVDSAFSRLEATYYVRYMDDFLFLSSRRWPLRRAVRRLHDYFEDTGFECPPDKTQGGRTERGFDWLGVWFDATGPTGIALRARENHRARRLRLEEQARKRELSEEAIRQRVQQYEARWSLWAERQLRAALPDC